MDNLKYFPFYYTRFADGVRGYDMEFVGIYMMLLCRQAELNRIPNDLSKLSRWLGGVNVRKIEKVLFEKFKIDDDGFYNETLEDVLKEVVSKSQSARKSVNARWDRIKSGYERNTNVSETYQKSDTKSILIKESKVNKNKVKEKKEIECVIFPSFEDFWNLYDLKKDRSDCVKKWAKLTQSEKELIMAYIPDYHKSQPDVKYRRHPATFLNKRTWENEIKENNNNQKIFKDESELANFLNVRPDNK